MFSSVQCKLFQLGLKLLAYDTECSVLLQEQHIHFQGVGVGCFFLKKKKSGLCNQVENVLPALTL